MLLCEDQIPIAAQTEAACELLGLDPLYIANEGKLVAIVDTVYAESLLSAMRQHELGLGAACIGSVVADDQNFVIMKTSLGGMRVVDWLSGEPLPRIC